MTQYARPTSDIAVSSFYTTGTYHYTEVDESTFNDTDYTWSSAYNTPGTRSVELGAGSVTDPSSSSDHKVNFRWNINKHPLSDLALYIVLKCGSTTIRSWSTSTNTTGTWTSGTFTLTSGEADNITDYTDLRFYIYTVLGNSYQSSGGVSWIEFECPDAGGGPSLTVADIAHSQGLEAAGILAQAHVLVGLADLAHSQGLDAAGILAQAHSLVGLGDLAHAQALDAAGILAQAHSLVGLADLAHSQALDALAITRLVYPFADIFTGSDGDPWDATKWLTSKAI